MLSVGEAGRHSGSYRHLLEGRGFGFGLKLESSWEISTDERNRWPMEIWKGMCVSLLA